MCLSSVHLSIMLSPKPLGGIQPNLLHHFPSQLGCLRATLFFCPSGICPSCYLLLNHWAEFNQTCYMTSPHGKGVGEQVRPSIMLLATLAKSVGICDGVPSTVQCLSEAIPMTAHKIHLWVEIRKIPLLFSWNYLFSEKTDVPLPQTFYFTYQPWKQGQGHKISSTWKHYDISVQVWWKSASPVKRYCAHKKPSCQKLMPHWL